MEAIKVWKDAFAAWGYPDGNADGTSHDHAIRIIEQAKAHWIDEGRAQGSRLAASSLDKAHEAGVAEGMERAAGIAEEVRDAWGKWHLEQGSADPTAYNRLKVAADILGAVRAAKGTGHAG